MASKKLGYWIGIASLASVAVLAFAPNLLGVGVSVMALAILGLAIGVLSESEAHRKELLMVSGFLALVSVAGVVALASLGSLVMALVGNLAVLSISTAIIVGLMLWLKIEGVKM